MEYLDAYDEFENYLGKFPRDEVHEKGMWHNTVHCWLYDNNKNVYFQVRSDADKLYTTSSGHVRAGETLKEAFGREVKEEIGVDVDYDKAELIRVNHWQMDSEKNGKKIFDRAFANIHILNIGEGNLDFKFLDGEVNGIIKLNANDTLKLFHDEVKEIKGEFIGNDKKEQRVIHKEDFLV